MPSLPELTFYPETARNLSAVVREAALNFPAFGRKVKVCELATCRAACCHDGVYLSAEEAAGVRKLTERVLKLEGFSPPHDPLEVTPGGKVKTRTKPASSPALDYPEHFPKTRCVFLDDSHRCGLQALAMSEGKAPWFYKPLTCWLHPIFIKTGHWADRPVVTLPGKDDDAQKKPGYPGFSSCTHCGREDGGGLVAAEALGAELDMLGDLSGRDVRGELRAFLEDS